MSHRVRKVDFLEDGNRRLNSTVSSDLDCEVDQDEVFLVDLSLCFFGREKEEDIRGTEDRSKPVDV